ncbi:MAG: hypothetical protein ACKVH8_00560 [Pirellulales bacterium]
MLKAIVFNQQGQFFRKLIMRWYIEFNLFEIILNLNQYLNGIQFIIVKKENIVENIVSAVAKPEEKKDAKD